MSRLVALTLYVLLMFVASPLIGIATQIYGWGLQAQSWGWIIGGYVVMLLLMLLGEAIKGIGDE